MAHTIIGYDFRANAGKFHLLTEEPWVDDFRVGAAMQLWYVLCAIITSTSPYPSDPVRRFGFRPRKMPTAKSSHRIVNTQNASV